MRLRYGSRYSVDSSRGVTSVGSLSVGVNSDMAACARRAGSGSAVARGCGRAVHMHTLALRDLSVYRVESTQYSQQWNSARRIRA